MSQQDKSNSSNLYEALRVDKGLPANCWRFTLQQELKEGFHISFLGQMPRERNRPRVWIGNQYLMRNRKRESGCVYHQTRDGFLVRRAELLMISPRSGARSFRVLNCPEKSMPDSFLLHVSLATEEEYRQRSFWCGAAGNAEVVMQEHGQALIRFSEECTGVCLFYPSGEVTSISYQENELHVSKLVDEEMIRAHLAHAQDELCLCDRDPEKSFSHREGILFDVLNLLSLEIVLRDENLKETIIDFLRECHRTPKVDRVLSSTLRKHGDTTTALEFADHGLFRGCNVSREKRRVSA